MLLASRLLWCFLLHDNLLLNDRLTIIIVVVLILIDYIARAMMKVLLALITPGALHSESTPLIVRIETARLSYSST